MRQRRISRLFGAFLFAAAAACTAQETGRTALDRYVAAQDPNYRYDLVRAIDGNGWTAYVLDMISQAWRGRDEVDRTVWRHWLTIVKPERVASSTALLFISGGSNEDPHPAKTDPRLLRIAQETGAVVAELRMVPNQPIRFAGEPDGREEDSLIAYSWDKFLRGGDDTWPAQLPMTKSAVRAMDTVTAFCRSEQGVQAAVDQFVVAGASKRGWTTWLTAAVDRRVVAIVPIVIDMLNLEKSFIHHWRAYGYWAPAVHDYVDMGIMSRMGRPEFSTLVKMVEPYEYRDRLTIPKFIMNSGGDQFFLPDSSQFYFDDLPGEKYLRYVPNTDHSLRQSDAAESLLVYFQSIVTGTRRPKFSWKFEKDGAIRVQATDRPMEVRLWQATNPNARDFRLETLGPVWVSTPVRDQGEGVYLGVVPKPALGWRAFFLEMTFPSGGRHPFKFTTPVWVLPDVLPFPPPKGAKP